jgi:hypothetical protein
MMNTRTILALSAAIEFVTGIALLAIPDFVARVLLGTELSNSGFAVARLAGCGLLSLGVACWQSIDVVSLPATRALFAYNMLAGLYLGYLRVGGGFAGSLLWPACLLHLALGLLLARPALAGN